MSLILQWIKKHLRSPKIVLRNGRSSTLNIKKAESIIDGLKEEGAYEDWLDSLQPMKDNEPGMYAQLVEYLNFEDEIPPDVAELEN